MTKSNDLRIENIIALSSGLILKPLWESLHSESGSPEAHGN